MTNYEKLSLAYTKGIGPRNFKKIINNPRLISEIPKQRTKKLSEQQITSLLKEDLVFYGDDNYPYLLSHITDSPSCLYYKGSIRQDWKSFVSIVGTRKMSNYGRRYTEIFTKELVDRGYGTVSGMAYGIDSIVHRQTLTSGGVTVAVLGTPVNKPYPRSNSGLYRDIIKSGLVVSEMHQYQELGKFNFAVRNRTIAGLTPATIVIEAPERSGALITAHLAFDYDREVFAVPGALGVQTTAGNNHLIKINKARLLDSLVDCFPPLVSKNPNLNRGRSVIEQVSYLESGVYESIKKSGGITFDELLKTTDAPKLASQLIGLEIKGKIVKQADGRYTLTS